MGSEATPAGFSEEDRVLIRAMGARLRQILQGKPYEPLHVHRRDDLGILASLTDRLAKELHLSRARDQQQRAELHHQIGALEQAQQTILDLSTPTLSIFEGVLLVPLIGALDTARAALVMSTVLESIAIHQTQVIILDVTGLHIIDTSVANALLQTARAAALLGARVCLCGIAPEVAQVIVGLGIDLSHLRPASDLQAALKQSLRMIGHQIVATPRPLAERTLSHTSLHYGNSS